MTVITVTPFDPFLRDENGDLVLDADGQPMTDNTGAWLIVTAAGALPAFDVTALPTPDTITVTPA